MATNSNKPILTLSDYKSSYLEKLKKFLNEFEDNRESDFIKKELIHFERILLSLTKEKTFIETEQGCLYNLTNESINELRAKRQITYHRIIEFLNQKLNSDNKKADSETKPLINFSNPKGTEKIIMLEKLGVLDYLRTKEPFNISTNQLASAISGITGINATTVQSYINPIISKDTDQKNNPLLRKKTVDKVNQKLIAIGFKPHQ